MKTEQIFILLGFSKLQKNILEVIKNFKSEIIIFDKKKITEDVRSYKIDCSDTDKVLKKLRDLEPILELKKKRIISYCGSEFGLHTASKINKFYNSKFLSSFENSKKFLEKEYSGNFFKKLNLNIPRRLTFKQGLERLKNNQLVIIKPAKQSGSIGVNLIKKKDVFKNTFKK